VLEDFVIVGNLFFVLCHHFVDTVNSSVCTKLLEFGIAAKLLNVGMEYDIISHAEHSFGVLIWFTFAYTIGQ
jgi:hypothetical protein